MKERHKILLISAFICFTFYYIYDIPAALNKYLHLQDDPYNAQRLTLLYSVYALPNMILPLLFTSQNGINEKTKIIVLCFCVFFGHVVFTFGTWLNGFKTMLLGRFIYGIGGESFSVIQNKIISHAFRDKELALSMSISSAIARTGTVLNYLLTPYLAHLLGKMFSCSVGVVLTFCGFIACLVLVRYNDEMEKNFNVLKECLILEGNSKLLSELVLEMNTANNETKPDGSSLDVAAADNKTINFFNEYEETKNSPEQTSSTRELIEKPFIKGENHAIIDGWRETSVLESKNTSNKTPDLSFADKVTKKIISSNPKTFTKDNDTLIFEPDLKGKLAFSPGFSLLVAISFMFAVVWAPYSNIASLLFQKRYQIGNIYAGQLLALQESLSIVFSIVIGCVSDFVGYKLFFVAFGSVLMITSHFLIYYNYGSVYLPILILGLAGPFIMCYWPCITYLVSLESLTMGFSIFTCVLNVAYTFSPIMVGVIVTNDATYDTVEFFEICIGILAAVFISYLCIINRNMKLRLNRKSYTS